MNVFYNANQNVANNISFSPSAGKPVKAVELFKSFNGVDVVSAWEPLTTEDFYTVHDKDFVDGILSCRQANGFGNFLPSVAASLPWTNGSFYNASVAALSEKIAVSPTSGFHHAGTGFCGGFCTFNGLMISAVLLHTRHGVGTIGIIDFDAHWGNGTDDILRKNDIDYVRHVHLEEFLTDNTVAWLQKLEKRLEKHVAGCDLLMYQAGADCHCDDPLAGYLRFTEEQMKERDAIVFAFAKRMNIPLVWNLAGGYQEPVDIVVRLHGNTMRECLRVFGQGHV